MLLMLVHQATVCQQVRVGGNLQSNQKLLFCENATMKV